MSKWISDLNNLFKMVVDAVDVRTGKAAGKQKHDAHRHKYDKEAKKPVLKCSICNGEQVAGFKDICTGKFEEVTLIRNEKDLKEFMSLYGIDQISKEY